MISLSSFMILLLKSLSFNLSLTLKNFSLLILSAYANLPLLNLLPPLTTPTSSLNSFNTLFMTIMTSLSLLTLSPLMVNTSLLTMITTFITPLFIILSANGTLSLTKSLFTNSFSFIFNTHITNNKNI